MKYYTAIRYNNTPLYSCNYIKEDYLHRVVRLIPLSSYYMYTLYSYIWCLVIRRMNIQFVKKKRMNIQNIVLILLINYSIWKFYMCLYMNYVLKKITEYIYIYRKYNATRPVYVYYRITY